VQSRTSSSSFASRSASKMCSFRSAQIFERSTNDVGIEAFFKSASESALDRLPMRGVNVHSFASSSSSFVCRFSFFFFSATTRFGIDGGVSAAFCFCASALLVPKSTGSFGVGVSVGVFLVAVARALSPRRRCSAAMRRLNAPIFGVNVHSSSTYALLLGLLEPAPACNRSVARRNASPLNTNGVAAALDASDARVVSSTSFSLANDARVGRAALVGCRVETETELERAMELPEGVVGVRSPLPTTSSTELSLSSHNECCSSLSRLRRSNGSVACVSRSVFVFVG